VCVLGRCHLRGGDVLSLGEGHIDRCLCGCLADDGGLLISGREAYKVRRRSFLQYQKQARWSACVWAKVPARPGTRRSGPAPPPPLVHRTRSWPYLVARQREARPAAISAPPRAGAHGAGGRRGVADPPNRGDAGVFSLHGVDLNGADVLLRLGDGRRCSSPQKGTAPQRVLIWSSPHFWTPRNVNVQRQRST
jgi:hypothetical protein